jgi:hypothetical protein
VLFAPKNAIFFENSIMQMRSKFTVEYLKTRGAQNLSDNGIEFLGSLLLRISCQMNFARLNRSLHAPPARNPEVDFQAKDGDNLKSRKEAWLGFEGDARSNEVDL